MEKFYRAPLRRRELRKIQSQEEEKPIELDNKYFNLPDGSPKTLDFLENMGTLTKGDLAARGIIKLCPPKYNYDYGAVANPIRTVQFYQNQNLDEYDDELDFENEWDNIFKLQDDTQEDDDDSISSEKNFFCDPEINLLQAYPIAN